MTEAAVIESVARECLRLGDEVAIDPDEPFALMGLDSLKTIELAAALEDALGCELPAEMLAECRDIRSLSARLRERRSSPPPAARHDDPFARMLADARLPGDVRPVCAGEPSTSLRDATCILLTGATGFLGGALLSELLATSRARILCLVRARNGAATGRLAAHDRVEVVEGDLASPRLGLTAQQFQQLASRLDAICHAGASVNWVFSYGALRASNVDGTLELLRLASAERAIPFHFVSSLSVCYASDGPARAPETFDALPHLRGVHLGYAQSKVVGEALVREAGERGLPVRIYRPALISGHSVTGAFNADDLITTLIRACVEMGTAPDLDWKLDCQPVDEVARSIVAASGSEGPVFHIGCERPRHWRELVLWMRMYGYSLRLVPHHAWLRQLDSETRPGASSASTHPLRGLRSFFLDRIGAARGLTLPELYEESRRTKAEASVTNALLAGAGVARRPIDASLLDIYFDAFRKAGQLPAPAGSARLQPCGHEASGAGLQPCAHPDILSAPFLSRLVGETISRVEVSGSGSDHSIISELTAWSSGRRTGLFRLRVDGYPIVLKAKAEDKDVIAVGEALASLVDPAISRAYARWRDRIGFTAGHVREIEIYRQRDPRFIAHAPALLGSTCAAADGGWLLALEDIASAALIDTADRPEAWTPSAIATGVDGLARLQAIWFGREQELHAKPWIGHVHSTASMHEMTDLWRALGDHAGPKFSSWAGPDIAQLHHALIDGIEHWWPHLEAGARTLIHNDFNPRNICLRAKNEGFALCAYDWELATIGAPQRDLAEFLCFAMSKDALASDADRWIDLHRESLARETGMRIDEIQWRRGFAAALGDLLVNRLASYALIDRVRRQPFLPRVVATWRRLYERFPIEGLA